MIKRLLSLLLGASQCLCVIATPPAPLSTNITALAGANVENAPTTPQLPPNVLKEVQTLAYVRNAELEAARFAVDAIPKFGFGGYPRTLISLLQVWIAQLQVESYFDDVLLDANNAQTIPPCQYTFSNDSRVASTDNILATLQILNSNALSANLHLIGSAVSTVSSFAVAEGAAIALKGQRAGYINTIAGVNPFPAQLDVAFPPVFAYWKAGGFVVPGSCPVDLDYSPFQNLTIISSQPPITPSLLAPYSEMRPESTLTLQFNATTAPSYAVLINQNAPPRYIPITVSGRGSDSLTSVQIPPDLVGLIYIALTRSNVPTEFDDVVNVIAAGPTTVFVPPPDNRA